MINWLGDHALVLLLAAGAAGSWVWLCLNKDRLRIKWPVALALAVLHTLYGVLSVKVFAFLETGFDTDSLGNMSLFGGVFALPLMYWLVSKYTKQKCSQVFDVFTPCLIFTLLCARINCILSGCCKGLTISWLPGFRYPTREVEILFYIVLLAVFCPKIRRGEMKGSAYPLYMISYGIFRFLTEFLRVSRSDTLFHVSHIWAMTTFLIGISIYAEMNNKNKEKRRV